MNTSKTLLAIAALALATAASAAPLITENFDDVSTLPGWILLNQSAPPGQSWFQGNSGVFSAHAGAPGAYVAADFLSALNGTGTIDNWLISPVVTLSGLAQLSFFTRTQLIPGFFDILEVRFHSGVSALPSDFTSVLSIVGGSHFPDQWGQVTAAISATGSGRFAFHYTGDAAFANYIGIDTVSLVTVQQVPEPSTIALLGLGLAALARARRKQRQPS